MDRLSKLIIGLLLISPLAMGQQDNSVTVFVGRKVPFKPQLVLDLSFQSLTEVPIKASNQEIEILILDDNNIEKLPNWIGGLKNLKVLSVRNNKLTDLNSAITFCGNLQQLYLSGNKRLSDLPNLSSLDNLTIIDAVDTKINELPGWAQMMDNLYYFKFTERK
jgi:Leucine-rich repeat (LRR) protein